MTGKIPSKVMKWLNLWDGENRRTRVAIAV